MYGNRDYLVHLGYGAIWFFLYEILRGKGNMFLEKYIPVPYSHKYCTVSKGPEAEFRTNYHVRHWG